MKTVKDWRGVYEAELLELELTSDEEAIRKEVAEYEEKLRTEYATRKQAKILHLSTAIEILNEMLFREEQEELTKEVASEEVKAEEEGVLTLVGDSVEEIRASTVVEENLFNI